MPRTLDPTPGPGDYYCVLQLLKATAAAPPQRVVHHRGQLHTKRVELPEGAHKTLDGTGHVLFLPAGDDKAWKPVRQRLLVQPQRRRRWKDITEAWQAAHPEALDADAVEGMGWNELRSTMVELGLSARGSADDLRTRLRAHLEASDLRPMGLMSDAAVAPAGA